MTRRLASLVVGGGGVQEPLSHLGRHDFEGFHPVALANALRTKALRVAPSALASASTASNKLCSIDIFRWPSNFFGRPRWSLSSGALGFVMKAIGVGAR